MSPSSGQQTDSPTGKRNLRGIVLVICAFSVLPALDAIAKHLTDDYHVAQIVWARLLFQAIVVLLFLGIRRQLSFTFGTHRWLLLGAIAAIWLANFPIIVGLSYLPLADAFALIMTTPLLVTLLSAWLLSEPVSRQTWLSVFIGFIGALVIVRPGIGVFHWAGLLPLLSAALFALYQIATKRLTAELKPTQILLWASVIPLIASSTFVGSFWSTPTSSAWLLMVVMGIGAGLGHFLLIAALKFAPASVLAPFMYLQLISSTLIGLAIFNDLPDLMTIAGAIIIVGSGLYAMRVNT